MGHELDAGIAKSCLDCRWLGTSAKRGVNVLRSKVAEANLGPGPWCHAARPCIGMSEWAPPDTDTEIA